MADAKQASRWPFASGQESGMSKLREAVDGLVRDGAAFIARSPWIEPLADLRGPQPVKAPQRPLPRATAERPVNRASLPRNPVEPYVAMGRGGFNRNLSPEEAATVAHSEEQALHKVRRARADLEGLSDWQAENPGAGMAQTPPEQRAVADRMKASFGTSGPLATRYASSRFAKSEASMEDKSGRWRYVKTPDRVLGRQLPFINEVELGPSCIRPDQKDSVRRRTVIHEKMHTTLVRVPEVYNEGRIKSWSSRPVAPLWFLNNAQSYENFADQGP